MKSENGVVRTSDGKQWEYTSQLPESVNEALENYGEDGTLFLIQSALTVKQQGIAREGFKRGLSRDDVDKSVSEYKPGQKRGGKAGLKDEVFKKLVEHSAEIAANDEVAKELREAFKKANWRGALEIIKRIEGGEG